MPKVVSSLRAMTDQAVVCGNAKRCIQTKVDAWTFRSRNVARKPASAPRIAGRASPCATSFSVRSARFCHLLVSWETGMTSLDEGKWLPQKAMRAFSHLLYTKIDNPPSIPGSLN
jgi:hypothetical protein